MLENPKWEATVKSAPWVTLKRLKSGIQTWRKCCSMIVDAIMTWSDYVKLPSVIGHRLDFDTVEIRLDRYCQLNSREKRRDGRYLTSPKIRLRWRGDAGGNASVEERFSLFVFDPQGTYG